MAVAEAAAAEVAEATADRTEETAPTADELAPETLQIIESRQLLSLANVDSD